MHVAQPAGSAPSGQPVLDVHDLCVNRGPERVLSDVTLAVQPREFVGIAGPNGGGKSTLLRAVLGLLPTCCGEVRLFGTPLASFRDHARIGFVPQSAAHVDAAFPATAREVVAMGLLARRGGRLARFRQPRARLVAEALAAVGVAPLARRRIGELSGGERQRVLLAKALASRPDLLILDEPTTGVDPAARDAFAHLLLDLNREQGVTILLVSHDDDLLHHAATRLLVVDRTIRGDTHADPGASTLTTLHQPSGSGHGGR